MDDDKNRPEPFIDWAVVRKNWGAWLLLGVLLLTGVVCCGYLSAS